MLPAIDLGGVGQLGSVEAIQIALETTRRLLAAPHHRLCLRTYVYMYALFHSRESTRLHGIGKTWNWGGWGTCTARDRPYAFDLRTSRCFRSIQHPKLRQGVICQHPHAFQSVMRSADRLQSTCTQPAPNLHRCMLLLQGLRSSRTIFDSANLHRIEQMDHENGSNSQRVALCDLGISLNKFACAPPTPITCTCTTSLEHMIGHSDGLERMWMLADDSLT